MSRVVQESRAEGALALLKRRLRILDGSLLLDQSTLTGERVRID